MRSITSSEGLVHTADQPHRLETTQPQLLSFSLWNLQWQSLTDLTVFNAQRSPKTTVKTNFSNVRMEPWKSAWSNLHGVSRTYARTICRDDFIVVFSVAFSVLSLASPWRSLPSLGRFVVFGPSSSHPSSSVHTQAPPVLLVCMQPGLPQRVRRSVSACAHGSTAKSWIEPSVAY